MQLSFDLVSAIGFYITLALVFAIFRKKVKIIQGVIIGFTTKKFNSFLRKFGSHRKFWRWIGNFAIIVSFIGMIFISYYLIKVTYLNLIGFHVKSVGLVLPGIKIPGSPIFIPFWYGIISIFILILVHEFSHGIMAYAEKIKVKSVGFGLLLLFPVAFVLPDEKKFEKLKGVSRARIAAMGPFANVILFLFASFLIALITHFAGSQFYVSVYSINSTIPNGSLVYAVNGIHLNNAFEIMKLTKNQQAVNLSTSAGNYTVNISQVYFKFGSNFPGLLILLKFLNWLGGLSIAIGLVNLLPIMMLDGSLMLDGLLEKVIKDTKIREDIFKALTVIFIGLLAFNLVISYI